MKAVRIEENGGVDVMNVVDLPVPEVGQDELLVKIVAGGVNFVDTYHRSGLYAVKLPFVLGKEAAGTVVKTGSGVEEFKEDDRVVFFIGGGCYAEYVCIDKSQAVRVPEKVSLKDAAAAYLQGLTAHYLATGSYKISKGDTVLVHAGAGGTGGILIQIAKILGANVITTVGTADKAEIVKKLGADHVILYKEQNFHEAVMKLTDGKGVHCVYDGVGAATWEDSLKCVQMLGTLVLFGNASGAVPPINPLRLTKQGSVTLIRPSLAHYIATSEALQKRTSELFGWIEDGSVVIRIGREFPLAEVRDAHNYLTSRQSTGKILLVP